MGGFNCEIDLTKIKLNLDSSNNRILHEAVETRNTNMSEDETLGDDDSNQETKTNGQLVITIHKGLKLGKKGFFNKSDPYVILQCGDQIFRSNTVKNKQNPVWDFEASLNVTNNTNEEIGIKVFDDDNGKDDS